MNILRNLIGVVLSNMRAGMSPREAVDDVSDRFGISKDGKAYAYLLRRAEEEKA